MVSRIKVLLLTFFIFSIKKKGGKKNQVGWNSEIFSNFEVKF